MAADRVRERLPNPAHIAGGYTKNGTKLILAEGLGDGRQACDPLICKPEPASAFDFKPGTAFRGLSSG